MNWNIITIHSFIHWEVIHCNIIKNDEMNLFWCLNEKGQRCSSRSWCRPAWRSLRWAAWTTWPSSSTATTCVRISWSCRWFPSWIASCAARTSTSNSRPTVSSLLLPDTVRHHHQQQHLAGEILAGFFQFAFDFSGFFTIFIRFFMNIWQERSLQDF